jgi:hypothetical protein
MRSEAESTSAAHQRTVIVATPVLHWTSCLFYGTLFSLERICNPSYSGDRDREDWGLKPARGNSSWGPNLLKKQHKTGLVAARVVEHLPSKCEALDSNSSAAKKRKKERQRMSNRKLEGEQNKPFLSRKTTCCVHCQSWNSSFTANSGMLENVIGHQELNSFPQT